MKTRERHAGILNEMRELKSEISDKFVHLQHRQMMQIECIKYIMKHSGSRRLKELTNRVLNEEYYDVKKIPLQFIKSEKIDNDYNDSNNTGKEAKIDSNLTNQHVLDLNRSKNKESRVLDSNKNKTKELRVLDSNRNKNKESRVLDLNRNKTKESLDKYSENASLSDNNLNEIEKRKNKNNYIPVLKRRNIINEIQESEISELKNEL